MLKYLKLTKKIMKNKKIWRICANTLARFCLDPGNCTQFQCFCSDGLMYLWTQSWCLNQGQTILIIKPSHNVNLNYCTQFILHLPVSMYIYTRNLVVYFGHLEFVIVVDEDISNLLSLCSNKAAVPQQYSSPSCVCQDP